MTAPETPPGGVLDAWGLRGGDTMAVLGGLNNRHWRVESDRGPVALRRYGPDAGPDAVAYERAWLAVLSQAGVWVPRPLAARDGSTVVEADGHLWAAFEWMTGRPPARSDLGSAAGAGAALAQAHLLCPEVPPPRPGWGYLVDYGDLPRWSGWTMRATLSCLEEARPDQAEAVTSVVEKVDAGLEPYRSTLAAHVVVVHYDLHPENVRVLDEKIGILDWDFAHPDARAVDLAIVLRNWPESFEALLTGYETVLQLRANERAAIPLLAIARGLDHLADRLTRWTAGMTELPGEIEVELLDATARLARLPA